MVNHSEMVTTKMPLFKSRKHAIHCVAGHDSHISGNANINYDSHTIPGYSYQCLAGQNAKTFLAGEKHFTVTITDYEMFVINQIFFPTQEAIRKVKGPQSCYLCVS